MKKLLALLLSLILVMSMLASCDSSRDKDDDDDDEETTEATNESTTDAVPDDGNDTPDPAPSGDFDLIGKWNSTIDYGALIGLEGNANVKVVVEFKSNDEYTMTMDKDDMLKIADLMIAAITAEGSSFEDAMGMSEDDYRASVADEANLTQSGSYTYENDVFTMDDADAELEIVSDSKIVITSDGIPLELTKA